MPKKTVPKKPAPKQPEPRRTEPEQPPAPAPSPVVSLPLPLLIAAGVGLLALGLGLGTAGAFLQARTLGVGVRLPVGSLVSIAALGAAAVSGGLLLRSRLGVGAVALGWLISVGVFTSGRPEGDVVIAADLPGYGYLLGGIVLLGLASVVPLAPPPERSPRAGNAGA